MKRKMTHSERANFFIKRNKLSEKYIDAVSSILDEFQTLTTYDYKFLKDIIIRDLPNTSIRFRRYKKIKKRQNIVPIFT